MQFVHPIGGNVGGIYAAERPTAARNRRAALNDKPVHTRLKCVKYMRAMPFFAAIVNARFAELRAVAPFATAVLRDQFTAARAGRSVEMCAECVGPQCIKRCVMKGNIGRDPVWAVCPAARRRRSESSGNHSAPLCGAAELEERGKGLSYTSLFDL